jgi:capsular polysaccharide biosynthesis protein
MTVPRIRVLRALRRRAWVIVVAVALCAAAAVILSGARKHSYTSSALLLVSSGADAKGPGDASEAINLASTYATLIPQDPGVTKFVGHRLGLSAGDVEDDLTASHLTSTGLITLSFKNDDADTAVKGAALTVRAVTGKKPTSDSIGVDSMRVVRAASHDQGFSDKQTISPTASLALAIILGLFLGVIVLIAWERADPRIDEPGDVELAAHLPASRLQDLSPSARAALVQRLAGQAAPDPVDRGAPLALLPSGSSQSAELLDAGDSLWNATANARGGLADSSPTPAIVLGGNGPQELETLQAAETGGARIVVAQQGMKVSRLVAAIHHYERLGLAPQWVLMVKKAGRARRRAAAAEDVSWLPRDTRSAGADVPDGDATAEHHTEDVVS